MFNLKENVMKKLLLAVCLMFGGATLVSAQTPAQTQDQEQISISELPDQVTAKLESSDYAGWTVGSAFKKMNDANQEIFVIELRQGTETKKVKFDRDGNEIEKDKQGKKSDNSNYRDLSEDPAAPEEPVLPEPTTPEQQ